MEAFADLLAGLLEAVCQLMMAAIELIAALLALLLELLFVLVTEGYRAARKRYGKRKEERRVAREAARQKQAKGDTAPNNHNGTPSLLVTGVVLLVMLTIGCTFYYRNKLRKQRIEQTQIQLASIADDVAQLVRKDVQPLPENGHLEDRDAWNRPIELSLQDGVLGTRIVVRSDGPDKKTGTVDDIRSFKHINHSVKEVTGELARRGIDKLKDKVAGFLPAQDESAIQPHP